MEGVVRTASTILSGTKNDEVLLHNQTGGNARWHYQER